MNWSIGHFQQFANSILLHFGTVKQKSAPFCPADVCQIIKVADVPGVKENYSMLFCYWLCVHEIIQNFTHHQYFYAIKITSISEEFRKQTDVYN